MDLKGPFIFSMLVALIYKQIAFGQTLFYEAFTDNSFTTNQEWTIMGENGIYSDCGSIRLLGGYRKFGVGSRIMKLFILPPHHKIQITFEFFKFDTWDNEYFYFYADADLLFTAQYLYGPPDVNLCGIPEFSDTLTNVNTIFTHNFQSLFIFMTSNIDEPPENESWGIRNFKLYLFLCPPGCQTCNSTDIRQTCLSWIFKESGLLFLKSDNFDGWLIDYGYKEITQCGPITLLGGFEKTGSNSIIMKQISLPTHTSVKIKFRFVSIDAWDSKNAYMFVDGIQYWSFSFNYNFSTIQNVCGDVYDEIFSIQEITIIHAFSQITIKFQTDLDQGYNVQSFGIRDFELFTICSAGDNQFCGDQCGNGIKERNEICDDGNIYPFDGCFNCQFSCVQGCSNCINGLCIECLIGWEFVIDLNLCMPIQNDQLIVLGEVCDEIIHSGLCLNESFLLPENCEKIEFGYCKICKSGFLLNDIVCEPVCQDLTIVNQIECNNSIYGCYQCQSETLQNCQESLMDVCLQCSPGWSFNEILQTCEPICGDEIINGMEQCDVNQKQLLRYDCFQCKLKCQDVCINCQYGKCYKCQQGWIAINFKCSTVCGDGLLVGEQTCDDQNLDHFDGCYACQNDCQPQCQVCQKGECLSCIYGWSLSSQGICETHCGDSQLALFSQEECEDDSGLYGCLECKLQCCPECFLCNFGICFTCNPSFTLIQNQCLPICGDGLLSIGYEECDDINDESCTNCQYQCQETCQNCFQGKCLDNCQHGYSLVNSICVTNCGDKIISGLEECDDGNTINFDGCFQCLFACPVNCNLCSDGQCIECKEGFQIKDNYCQPQCGDGQVAIGIEGCDDENNMNLDGCLIYCQVEVNYLCNNNNTLSQCTFVEHPKLKLNYIKQEYQYQYVQIYFTQSVKSQIQSSFINYIKLSLNIDDEYYTTIQIIQDASEQISNVEYQVAIFINQTLTTQPVLYVKLLDYLYNEFDAPLSNLNEEINLQLPKILSDSQKETAIKLGKISSNLMSSLGGIGIISLLLGNSFILWEQLEMLQQQSYLRFVNVVFPENLFIYFESSNLISMQPIQDFIKFDSITIETPFQESYEKFKFYEINANILANLKTQILIIIITVTSYGVCLIVQKGLNKLQMQHFAFFGLLISKLILKLKDFINKFLRDLQKEGIKQIFIANIWDLFFISFLQIKAISFISFNFYLRFSVAISILIFLIMLASEMINKNSIQCFRFQQYWVSKQKFFLIFKKLIFIGILVFFQSDQITQTILLSQVSIIYLAYILAFQPVKCKFEYAKLIMMEVTVVIFLLTQFVYWDCMEIHLNYQRQVNVGWFHIAILVSTLIVSLLFQLLNVIKKAIYLIKEKKRKYAIQKQNSNPFPLQRVLQNLK